MGSTLIRLVLEHLRHRPLRVSLTVVGVAVGVSAWLAIRLANDEVLRVFHQSVDSAVGRISLVIKARSGDLDERVIGQIRQHSAVQEAIPMVTMTATIVNGPHSGRTVQIWGLDLLGGIPMDGVRGNDPSGVRPRLDVLLAPDTVFVNQEFAAEWKLAEGARLGLHVDGSPITVTVRGIGPMSGPGARVFTDALIMDIATAQALFGRVGRLDRIDIVKAREYPTARLMTELEALLPPSLVVSRVRQRGGQVEAMILSFQLNLEVLSSVGLLIGIFLVYNTVGFSVVQHRREIGILRALGFSHVQIQTVFLGEAAVLGSIGGLLGAVLGVAMTDVLTDLVSQSVSDLYARVATEEGAPNSPLPWGEGLLMGIGLAICGALRPCREAGNTVVVKALAPGDYESSPGHRLASTLHLSLAACLLSLICLVPGPVYGLPLFGYASAFFLLLACVLLGPVGIQGLIVLVRLPVMKHLSVNGRLAADHLARAPGRSSVTISALVIGLAVIVGVGTMIRSFRVAVEEWIDQTIVADLIVGSLLSQEDETVETALPMSLLTLLQAVEGVAAVDPYRQRSVQANGRPVTLVARDLTIHAERSGYLFRTGDSPTLLRQTVARSGAIVSEVLAQRLQVGEGDTLLLETDVGFKRVPIVGVFYDYATDGGKVVIDHGVYRQWWHDNRATVFAVYLHDAIRSEMVRHFIEAKLGRQFPISTISHHELRTEILAIFDRTFRVTFILEFIALGVALLGIMNTLTTAIFERRRELATLRALGASIRQIHRLVFWESGYLAGIGVVLGVLGGMGLATVLVKVINKQSFGWTIPLALSGGTVLDAIAVAGIAAMLAAYLPVKWTTTRVIAEGLRYE